MSKNAQKSGKTPHKARLELVVWLALQSNSCDEEEAMKAALAWWELSDEQLLQATEYILLGQSPLRDIISIREDAKKHRITLLQKG